MGVLVVGKVRWADVGMLPAVDALSAASDASAHGDALILETSTYGCSDAATNPRAFASENYGILLDYFQGNCDNPLILIAVDKSPCVKRTSSDP